MMPTKAPNTYRRRPQFASFHLFDNKRRFGNTLQF
jgi:hypothetical protein